MSLSTKTEKNIDDLFKALGIVHYMGFQVKIAIGTKNVNTAVTIDTIDTKPVTSLLCNLYKNLLLDLSNEVNTFSYGFSCKSWAKNIKDPLDPVSNNLQLDLKEITLQWGGGSHHLSAKETDIILLTVQKWLSKKFIVSIIPETG